MKNKFQDIQNSVYFNSSNLFYESSRQYLITAVIAGVSDSITSKAVKHIFSPLVKLLHISVYNSIRIKIDEL